MYLSDLGRSAKMKVPLLILCLSAIMMTSGCIYYSDDQIRYTDSEHKSGQIKDWDKPGIQVPLN